MTLDPVTRPQWRPDHPDDARAVLRVDLRRWLTSEPLIALARAWGGHPPLAAPTAELYSWFDEFSEAHWDFRRGVERNLASAATLSSDQERVVMDAAEALGLADARPPEQRKYDYTLVLGGLVRACVVRPRYAARLDVGGCDLGHIAALGGFRPLGGDEVDLAHAFGIDEHNEFDAMVMGMRAAFGLGDPPSIEASTPDGHGNDDWRVATFPERPAISVIAAPSREPAKRRATTPDTYRWWAERHRPLAGKTVLLITSAIYVPYQEAGAIEVLGMQFEASVEMVGVPTDVADLGQHTQRFTPGNYLQEIRSAIRGYHSLLVAAS